MNQRRLILGTAGHVDHGKTQLVTRLTGWNTDRLKEEKERGISIELGFAPLRLDEDTMIGIVDVPGHERFVRHMVAGAGGIDLALLVIAGDEGVMPQTKEHLEVLRALSVNHGVVVISKSDLASDDMRAIIEDDIAELVRGTFLENAPVVYTSVKSGDGVEELKTVLKELAHKVPERITSGAFRLAVDRVFHKQGIGVVVTGSCYSGTVSIGDSVELLPAEKSLRVREIQSFGEKREHGYAGERLAIALQGGKLGEVSRGDMLVTPDKFAVSYMLDARIRIASYAQFELKQRERIRFHHGAREVLGRVVLLDNNRLRSGEDGLVQFRLESPVVAGEGDYFVIRKYSPQRVLGGGRVIDPSAKKHKQQDAAVLDHLHLQEVGEPKERMRKAIEDMGLAGAAVAEFAEQDVDALLAEGGVLLVDKRLYDAVQLGELAKLIERLVTEYVAAHPLRRGMDKEELRQKVRFPHPPPVFNRVLESLAEQSAITIEDKRVHAGSASDALPQAVAAELAKVKALYKKAGLQFPKNDDVAQTWLAGEEFADAFQFLRDEGAIVRIADDAHVDTLALRACVEEIKSWFDTNAELSVGNFKDLFGVTRKHAIPLLEYMDQARLTTRSGNARVRGPRLAALE